MTRPLDEEWTMDDAGLLYSHGGQNIIGSMGRSERAALASAAPNMARALLEVFGEAKHISTCHALRDVRRRCHPDCAAARSALQKAGVLP